MKYIIALLFSFFLLAIANTAAQEQIVIHRNQPYYVVGDIVHYDVKLSMGFKSKKVAINHYVTNSSGGVLKQHFTVSEQGESMSAYFYIPFTWNSDVYQIALYGLPANSAEEILIAKIDIPIYNDISGTLSTANTTLMPKSSKNGKKCDVSLSQANYSPRATVDGKVSAKDIVPESMSISVLDERLFSEEQIESTVSIIDLSMDKMTIANLVESPYITGSIVDQETADPMRVNVLGAYDIKGNAMLYSKSDKTGRFKLVMDDYVGSKKLHFNAYLFHEYDDIKVVPTTKLGLKAGMALPMDSTIMSYIDMSRMRKKIYQQYDRTEHELLVKDVRQSLKELNPNRTYEIKDYQSFKNLALFFNELIASGLSFVETGDGRYKARMYNSDNNRNRIIRKSEYFPEDPIFIVDGKVTMDADRVGKLPLTNIISAALYYKEDRIKKEFGTFGGSAYVIVTTNLPEVLLAPDEEDDIISWNGILAPIDSDELTMTSDTPILRSNIYWNAQINDSAASGVSFKFSHSDDISNYKIILSGLDETGTVQMGTAEYKARYNN